MKYSRVNIIVWGSVAGLLVLALIVRHDWLALGKGTTDMVKGPRGSAVVALPVAVSRAPANNKEGRDPFSEAPADSADANTLLLNGISWDPVDPVAVINDVVVGVGQEVAGYKVISIAEQEVVLSDGQKELRLTLPVMDVEF